MNSCVWAELTLEPSLGWISTRLPAFVLVSFYQLFTQNGLDVCIYSIYSLTCKYKNRKKEFFAVLEFVFLGVEIQPRERQRWKPPSVIIDRTLLGGSNSFAVSSPSVIWTTGRRVNSYCCHYSAIWVLQQDTTPMCRKGFKTCDPVTADGSAWLLSAVCWERQLMCCGIVALCQTADELQVVCGRHGLTDCVISPVSHTFMPFTHKSPPPLIIVFYPAGTGSWNSPHLSAVWWKTAVNVWIWHISNFPCWHSEDLLIW